MIIRTITEPPFAGRYPQYDSEVGSYLVLSAWQKEGTTIQITEKKME
jgi:hypothetical protein